MKKFFGSFIKILPSIILSLLLSITVWVIAVTEKDPTEERRFPNTINIEVVGLSDDLVMTNSLPEQVYLKLRAPSSVWDKIVNDRVQATAVIDVTGLREGKHQVPVQIKLPVDPISIISYSPETAEVDLEKYETREFEVKVTEMGEIPTAFKGETPVVSPKTVRVSGAVSVLDQIDYIRVILNHSNATETISKDLPVGAISLSGKVINSGLTFDPPQVHVTQEINLRGGYRVVVVKVVTEGSVPDGYQVAKISVDPSVVTIYSSDRTLLESLPSYVETDPILLSEYTGDASLKIGLNLPEGISLVGDQSVKVDIQIPPIVSAKTFSNVPVYVIGLDTDQRAQISPETVEIYLSGPQPILNNVKADELYAVIDLQEYSAGHYQLTPRIDLASWEGVSVQSINPATIDVTITGGKPATPAPAPTVTATVQP